MGQLHYITGAAGTGKTYKMVEELEKWFGTNVLASHQSVLAITKMHGSRKRLQERLNKLRSINTRISISTVDSFALQLVNRWRLSLGYDFPIIISEKDEEGGFIKSEFGYKATFEEISNLAADLSRSSNVAKTIANSFPLILVDEFQDCTGSQLSLIKNLMGYVDFILAADPFQSLNEDESACKWVDTLKGQATVQITSLAYFSRRTTCSYLLEAGSALRENRPAVYTDVSLSLDFVPNYALAIWKVIPEISPNTTAALIYPAHKALTNLKFQKDQQDIKRAANSKTPVPFLWKKQTSDIELKEQIYTECSDAIKKGTWNNNENWRKIYKQAHYLARAKGYDTIPDTLLKQVINSFVQEKNFVTVKLVKFESTTVHGAKNREFDHVYILWDDNLCSKFTDEEKRRLLYNALTRAKKTCKVIAIGNEKNIKKNSVLALLVNSNVA